MKLGIAILFSVLLSACGQPEDQPKKILSQNLHCPEGSSSEIERWGGVGENGWLKACKMKHGTFTAWYGDVKAVEGEYLNGVEEGIWVYWNRDGKKLKEITFKAGKQVHVKEF